MGSCVQDYRNIKAWQHAHRLVLRVYAASEAFPTSERFGLVQQIRRAAVSVPANIAEGSKRLFKRDFVRFLNIAEASLREVDYYLVLARDLAWTDATTIAELLALADETSRMLTGFRKAVQRYHRSPRLRSPDDTPDSERRNS
jgi:four helix bundle protein